MAIAFSPSYKELTLKSILGKDVSSVVCKTFQWFAYVMRVFGPFIVCLDKQLSKNNRFEYIRIDYWFIYSRIMDIIYPIRVDEMHVQVQKRV